MYELIGEAGTNQREGAHLSLGLTQEPSILRAPSNAIRALLVFIMSLYYRHPSKFTSPVSAQRCWGWVMTPCLFQILIQ